MPQVAHFPTSSSEGTVVRVLKDGYWDRTEILEMADGTRRVRKRNKGEHAPGPWGLESLRREIRYFRELPAESALLFPTLLAWWDRINAGAPDIGYEIPYYPTHRDAGELARRGVLSQPSVDLFQDRLGELLMNRLHQPLPPESSLSKHMTDAIWRALEVLSSDSSLARVIQAEKIELNSRPVLGARGAMKRISEILDLTALIDAGTQVRIHGDLFLENVLWRETDAAIASKGGNESGPESNHKPSSGKSGAELHPAPQLIMIDPVSVAGISRGPPLFDLVKYESYATGVLPALRFEALELEGLESQNGAYRWSVRWQDPAVAAFRKRDWHSRLRLAYVAKYGKPDLRLYRFIDAYFSLAMALNTGGKQRAARLLKATEDLNAVLGCL